MARTTFHNRLDDSFRTERIRVRTDAHEYEGWMKIWNHSESQVLLYDAVRDDGEEFGTVLISEPVAVELLKGGPKIEKVAPDAIVPCPYDARDFEERGVDEFVRKIRDWGHLPSFPAVRPIDNGRYEIVSGHRRSRAAQKAGFEEIPVQIVEIDDWEATRIFVDEHFPIPEEWNESDDTWYTTEEIETALELLQQDWTKEKLQTLPIVEAHLNSKKYLIPLD